MGELRLTEFGLLIADLSIAVHVIPMRSAG